MKKKRISGRTRAVLTLALILAVVTAILTALFGTTWGQSAVQTVLTPIRSGVNAITRQVERYYNYIFKYESLEARNEYLEKRVAELENEVRSADSLQREIERLRELLKLQQEHDDYSFAPAYIVSWDSSDWKSTFTIGKGKNYGLETGMVAVTEYGQVLGLITEVGSNWATVTTILDTSLEISACISSTGHLGVVRGAYTSDSAGTLRMNYIATEAVLRNNDQVVTVGSTVYPRDLIIGYVADAGIDETGVAKYAVLKPAANFDELEQVFIITNYSGG